MNVRNYFLVVCIKQGGTQYYTRAGAMGVAALGRQTAYGARPSESRKLRAAAACMTEVASANAMAAEMAAVWCGKYEYGYRYLPVSSYRIALPRVLKFF